VARVEPAKGSRTGGFGITLEAVTREDGLRLKALIGRLAHLPPPRPATLSA
jgi:hypothetical protein